MFSQQGISNRSSAAAMSTFMSRVYLWMALGVLITGITSYAISQSPTAIHYIFSNNVVFIGLVILQLVVVALFAGMVNRMSASTAAMVYIFYAALLGVTVSVIFFLYTMESISSAFFLTSFSFAGLSMFGYVTKRDLGPLGSFCMIGLFGLIGVMFLGLFFPSIMSSAMQFATAVIGILIFAGLTAYDTQRIKSFSLAYGGSQDQISKGAIHGALILYLDFINLFLSVLRLMGDRR